MEAGRCTLSWEALGDCLKASLQEAEQKPAQDKKAGSQGACQLGGKTQVLFFPGSSGDT